MVSQKHLRAYQTVKKKSGTQAVTFTEVQQSEDQLKNKYKQEMKTYPKKKTPTLTKHNIKIQRHMRF